MSAVLMPARLQARPTFHGMPIPYTVYVDEAGVPDFRMNWRERMAEAVERGLCVLCGQRLGRRKVFVGGPSSIQHGQFVDGPMHEECARYAIGICPYLTGERPDHAAISAVEHRHRKEADLEIVTASGVAAGRPERMGLYFCFGYRHVDDWAGGRFFADPPIRVEWF
jgi:hypothetical protein